MSLRAVIDSSRRPAMRGALAALGLAAAVAGSDPARAACLTPPGDVTGNGVTNISDVQCISLVALWELAGGASGSAPPPGCVFGGPTQADLSCTGVVEVQDVQIGVSLALGMALSPTIDSNGSGCVDACELVQAVCGNGVVEVGEECDDGPANSDVLADFCRTDCTLPSCGDGVVDSGEQCDDGQNIAGSGCEPDCTFTGGVAFPLPYTQTFDSGTFASMAFTVQSDSGSTSNNWTLTTTGPLGPDQNARFFRLPQVTNYENTLVTPLLDASAAEFVTLRLDQVIALNGAGADTTFRILASSDGGDTWQPVWQHTGADGNFGPVKSVIDLSAAIGETAEGRIAFQIAGPNSNQILYWAIDTLEVLIGAPPVLASVPNGSVTTGNTATIPVSATDLDTPAGDLVFSVANAPSWVTIASTGPGQAELTLAPPSGAAGTYNGVRVQVSDGTFTASQDISVTVLPDPSEIPATITIRDQPGGLGDEVTTASVTVGQTMTLYAAGYNSLGAYLQDIPSVWATAGTLDPISSAPSSALIFSPNTANTSGIITATPTQSSIAGDSTGTITVLAPVGTGISLAASTVTVSPTAIEANGTDTATVSVALFDSIGAPVEGASVVIAATKGTLQGSVTEQGSGIYTQTILADSTEGVAAITATANGTPLIDSAILQFVDFIPIDSPTVIDCDNYTQFQLKNLEITSTLEVNSNPTAAKPSGCAPMQFGDVIVRSGGTMTHGATDAETTYAMDVAVRSLLVDAGGAIDVSERGYLGAKASNQLGFIHPNTDVLGTPLNVGGSHGGIGGREDTDRSVGSYVDPKTPGAGGGYNSMSTRWSGDGGGVVRIQAQISMIVHGAIRANGGNGQSNQGCGGAGGSIALTTPYLGGSGIIEANGGTGNSSNAGAGGGGRIAIRGWQQLAGSFAPAVLADNVRTCTQGCGSGHVNILGGAGTIYLRKDGQTYGSLIIDGHDRQSPEGFTPIPILPPGVVTSVSGQVMTDFAALWEDDFYVGTYMIPNIAQPGMANGPGAVTLFRVDGHTDVELELSGGTLASEAQLYDSYRGVLALDHLDIRRRASVRVDGDTIVRQGNFTNPVPSRLTLGGDLITTTLDIDSLDSVQITQGTLRYDALFSGATTTAPIAWELSAARLEAPAIHAQAMNLSATSFALSGTLTVQGGLTCSSSTIVNHGSSAGSAALTGCTSTLGAATIDGALTATGGTLDVDTLDVGAAATLAGNLTATVHETNLEVGGRLELKDTATLTHPPTEPGEAIRRLEIDAAQVVLNAGTFIDVAGMGFRGGISSADPTGYGVGNSQQFGATLRQGASHGGLGGDGNVATTAAQVYGAYAFPDQPGGGGGFNNSIVREGGRGGGVVIIRATTSVRVDGTISADGRGWAFSTSATSSGGAGGSIRIHTPVMAGNGLLRANGYNGYNNSTHWSGGGGGGRIAILDYNQRQNAFAGANIVNAVQAAGANGHGARNGGAGTVYLRSATQLWGELIIDDTASANSQGAPARSTPIPVVPQGAVSGVGPGTVSDGAAGWRPDRFVGSWINPNLAQGGPGSTLIDHAFFRIDEHDFTTLLVTGSGSPAAVATVGDTYRGVLPLDRLEVRGSASLYVDGDIVIRFGGISSTDPNTMLLEGTIEARTIDFNDVGVLQANQGGVIAEQVFTQGTDEFAIDVVLNNSTLDLPGLQATLFEVSGGTLNLGDLTVFGDANVSGTTLNAADIVIEGNAEFTGTTMDAGVVQVGAATLSGGNYDVARLQANSGLTLTQGATVTVHDATVTAPTTLRVEEGATLTHCPTTPDKICRLDISAGTVIVDSGSFIDANGRGFIGGLWSGPNGYTTGNQHLTGAGNQQGGSHGGLGGYAHNSPSAVYDSIFAPNQPGGGGGASAGYFGGDGGGVITISASSLVTVAGTIRANGVNGQSNWGSGGAGGTVRIHTPALNLEGTANVQAIGGNGRNNSSSPSGGGGGGRIAITGVISPSGLASETQLHERVTARGGVGWSTNRGGAGTIYFRRASQTYGSLLIDNNFNPTDPGSTPLPVVPQRVITQVSGSTLIDTGGSLVPGAYVGGYVNPNVSQAGHQDGIGAQQLFAITANTVDSLSLTGSVALGTVAQAGSVYRGVLALDNLEIRRGAQVRVDGDVWVREGDMVSNDAVTFRLGGRLDANILDLHDALEIQLASGQLEANALFGATGVQHPFVWSTSVPNSAFQPELTLPNVWAQSFTLDGGTIETASMTVTQDFTGDGASSVVAGAVEVGGDLDWNAIGTSVGALAVVGDAAMTGGTQTIGTLEVQGDMTLGGNAQMEITEETVEVGGTFQLTDTARLRHCETTADRACRLAIECNSLIVGESAWIDAEGRGYIGGTTAYPGYTYPNVPQLGTPNANYNHGGSHGGVGGRQSKGNVYGSYVDPQWPGAGAGYPTTHGGKGGDGGGVVLVKAAASVIVDGQIRVVGQGNTSGNNQGGAGGSINIEAGFVGGTGSLLAFGGASSTNTTWQYGAGAGGRIAIHAGALGGHFNLDAPEFASKVRVYGGSGWRPGAGGTAFIKLPGDTYGRLYIENANRNTVEVTPITLMPEGYVLGLDSEGRKVTDFAASWNEDQYAGTWVNLDRDIPIPASGLEGMTFHPIVAHGTNQMTLGGTAALGTSVGKRYRGVLLLDQLTVNLRGQLEVDSDLLVLDGNLSNAGTTTFTAGGRIAADTIDLGSVGGISLETHGTLEASEIYAQGAADFVFDITLNGGTIVEDVVHAGDFVLSGASVVSTNELNIAGDFVGEGSAAVSAQSIHVGGDLLWDGISGTFDHLQVEGNAELIGGTHTIGVAEVGGDLALRSNAALEITEDLLTVDGGLQLLDSSRLRHCETTATKTCRLIVEADSILIDDAAWIDVAERGYIGGSTTHPGYTYPNVAQPGTPNANYNHGGSHGGVGGRQSVENVYGNYTDPRWPGGGAGYPTTHGGVGGAGGGVAILKAASSILVNGQIRAFGRGNTSGNNQGGAGGSINLEAPLVGGTGHLYAYGGASSTNTTWQYGAGAGGRIAVRATMMAGDLALDSPNFGSRVRVYGGSGWRPGAGGTAFFKLAGDTYGRLYVENANRNTPEVTPITLVPPGYVLGVDNEQRVVTDFGATMAPGEYAGSWVSLHLDQPAAGQGLTSQAIFPVAGNSATTLSIGGVAPLGTAVGNRYRGVLALDQLTVANRGQLHVGSDLLVMSGNLSGAGTATLTLGGSVVADTIDLNQATGIDLQTHGLIDTREIFGHGQAAYAFETTLNGGTLIEDDVHATTLTLAGASTIDTGSLTVTTGASGSGTGSAQIKASELHVGSGGVQLAGVSLDVGALESEGDVDLDGAAHDVGTLDTDGSLYLRGSAALEIHDDLVHAGGDIQLLDTSRLRHCASTASKTCRLRVTCDALLVEASAWIDVEGRGYIGGALNTPAHTYPNVPRFGTANANYNHGGSHGGMGGRQEEWDAYGSYVDPRWPGGGAGYPTTHGGTGGAGGGAVIVNAQSAIVIHGQVRAMGATNTSGNQQGGAGGAINLSAPLVGGTGHLYAYGGGASTNTTWQYGGGGGGRVAVHATTVSGHLAPSAPEFQSRVRVYGGVGWQRGASGTAFYKLAGDTYGRLYLENNNQTTPTKTPLTVMPRGHVLVIDESGRTITDFGAGFPTGQYAGTWVSLDMEQPNADKGLSQQTFHPIAQHTHNAFTVGGTTALGTAVGKRYRGVLALDELTVRNRAHLLVDSDVMVVRGNFGAPSGGAFTLEGTLEADSIDLVQPTELQFGSVGGLVQTTVYQSGLLGTVSVDGGSISGDSFQFGALNAGSGTTITANHMEVTGDMSLTSPGVLNVGQLEVGGTLSVTSSANRSLQLVDANAFTMHDGSLNIGRLETVQNATLTGSAALTITDTYLTVGGHLHLQDTSRLGHADATTNIEYRLDVTAGSVTVDAAAAVDVDGRGYLGGTGSGQGRWFGNTLSGGAQWRTGGSHGGRGGRSTSNNVGNLTYGDYRQPITLGAGGGGGNSGNAGHGGGAVALDVGGALLVEGAIRAGGSGGTSGSGAGGAGGSIWVQASAIDGAGLLYARGGNGTSAGGGGGGGRVSLMVDALQGGFQLASLPGRVQLRGGTGGSSRNGGAGTLFLQLPGDTHGRLVVDNEDVAPYGDNGQNSTELTSIGVRTIADFPSPDSVQVSGVSWAPDMLVGSWVTLDANWLDGQGLFNEPAYRVLSNTNNMLILDTAADLALVANVGDPLRGIDRLDMIQVRERGQLFSTGDVLVLKGDLDSGSDTVLAVPTDSTLQCQVLDARGATITGSVTATIVP